MATATPQNTDEFADEQAQPALAGQSYEIIRGRLSERASELRERLAQLNNARKDVFGSIETKLLGTDRITTHNNCVPRDMVAVGDKFLFGYNVHIGLRKETQLKDVFSVYRYDNQQFHEEPLDLLADEQFERDFRELYTYYKNTTLAKFAIIGPYLFMVFRTGKNVDDIKTFKWMFAGDSLRYVDNRSDYEFQFPPQHEFEWVRATRDMHRSGLHPHISIEERVFVETVGGDLTIKIEDNTDSGRGILSESVDNPDQTLDDAEVYFAVVGNLILLKVRPYQESAHRFFVYNEKVQQARRIDAIADACVLLPDDHGLIFSQGYYLQTGEAKTFETDTQEMVFDRRIASPNGEDFLYVFFNRLQGDYILLSYNVISQEVSTPTICNGYAFFSSGELLTFRHHADAQKHHVIQIWQTPYTGESFKQTAATDSYLYKIGNKDLVRGMAECHEVLGLIDKEDSYANLYIDLTKKTRDIVDSYFWIDNEEAFELAGPLRGIHDAANAAISEFEKVTRLRKATQDEVARVTSRTAEIESRVKTASFETIDDFVHLLSELRAVRGEIISLRDLKYVDEPHVDTLEARVTEQSDRLAERCVEFLLREDALVPYEQRVSTADGRIVELTTVADAKQVEEEVDNAAGELELLIEIVSNLKIDDATQRTAIIDNISAIFSHLNKTRAGLKNKIRDLATAEGAAEFAAQLKLLSQAVVNYLDVCDTPEKCEEYLTKLMIQVEELEGRFGEFDEMVEELSEKREEIYNAFETRKLQLVEARGRRASTLTKSADRILSGVKSRVESFETVDEINGYFAGDLMVDKVRDIVRQLTELDESVKVGDIQSRLKSIREDAVRQLKDRKELFVDGQNVLQFGRHKFRVNTQSLDLTTVYHDDEMCFHLTGTNYFDPIADETFLATRAVRDQELVSENREVYRGEYLAWQMLCSALDEAEESVPPPGEVASMEMPPLTGIAQKYMAPRYAEGYLKGVHDHDGATILQALCDLTASIGLLRYGSAARTLAWLFWQTCPASEHKQRLTARLRGFGRITSLFPETPQQEACVAELQSLVRDFATADEELNAELADEAGEYLFHALAGEETFAISGDAETLAEEFRNFLESKAYDEDFAASQAALANGKDEITVPKFLLARDWIDAYAKKHDLSVARRAFLDEAAALLVEGEYEESRVIHTSLHRDLEGLVGNHPRIAGGKLRIDFNDFTARLTRFTQQAVSDFRTYQKLKHELVEEYRENLRLEEFRPRVLTSFVRNRLIDRVYLPLIGDNLAKQIGTAGEDTRTDRMGLLLLISPPGYGKTTLMEYVANRLGLIFMKINGPAIGHHVTSLDSTEAPNAAAREEMEKLNLALEMGDNVMIYLDDIQHVSPELLQKFISLCDATRKIEGVWKGKTRTYDLRGKQVCVVMAGNPYTESGERFQIPDMLANRADTYNLGEIIGESSDWFEMSYIENCLTSNPTLAPLATRHPEDIYGIIKIAETDNRESVDLAGNYSLDELGEYVNVMKKLLTVRDIILAVNQEYIRSAAQQDEYRNEPPFKLQGSYRNMNRLAERISPLMNEAELQSLVQSQYEQDAGTLTSGAEANLLKLKELCGWLTEEESRRWEEIKETFRRNQKFHGLDASDRFSQVIAQMSVFRDGLDAIRDAVSSGVRQMTQLDESARPDERMLAEVSEFRGAVEAMRDSLDRGVAGLQEKEPTSAGPIQATFAPDAMELLTKFIAELQLAGNGNVQGAGSPSVAAPYKVEVVNRVPRAFLSVIREQFRLLQDWMQPLSDVAKQNRTGLAELNEQLTEAMDRYDKLLDKLDRK